MNSSASRKTVVIVAGLGVIAFCVSTVVAQGGASSVSDLSIDPVYAVFTENEEGDSFHLVFAIINTGATNATIVTENLDFATSIGGGTESEPLSCTLSFDSQRKYKGKHLLVPSIHKYCPVTLKPGEVAMVNYYKDYSKTVNYTGWNKRFLEADNIVITYKISPVWANRFDLWQGELHSAPVRFTKRASGSSIQGSR